MDFEHNFFELYKLRNELNLVFVNLQIQNLATSFFSVFVPIYLILIGYSFQQAIIFVIVHYATIALFSPFAAYFASKYGFKDVIIFRLPIYFMYLINLYYLSPGHELIYIIAMLGGVSTVLHAISINSIFSRYPKKVDKKQGITYHEAGIRVISSFLPTIGGLFAVYFEPRILFMVGAILLVVSIVPLFWSKKIKPYYQFSLKSNLSLRSLFRYFVEGTNFIQVFVISMLGLFMKQGSIISVGVMLTMFYLGTFALRIIHRKVSLKIAAVCITFLWLARLFLNLDYSIYILSLLTGMAYVIIHRKIRKDTYDTAANLIFREFALGAGRITLLVMVLIGSTNNSLLSSAILNLIYLL